MWIEIHSLSYEKGDRKRKYSLHFFLSYHYSHKHLFLPLLGEKQKSKREKVVVM